MQLLKTENPNFEAFQEFLLALSLCHHASTQKLAQNQRVDQ